jgi:hypothetical protein
MAQITTISSERIAWLFERAEADWGEMAELLACWDELNALEQESFAHDVPHHADYLARLVRLAAEGGLTISQRERLRRLQALVRAIRPQINELTGYDLSNKILDSWS